MISQRALHITRKVLILWLLIGFVSGLCTAAEQQASKGLLFFYKLGRKIDNFCLSGVDTSYICLPEHSWHVALTCSELGIHSSYVAENLPTWGNVYLNSVTTPSADIGFSVGFRSFGFGYSWDVTHVYARKMSFSFGGKSIGVEFSRHRSANLTSSIRLPKFSEETFKLPDKMTTITNTNLSIWYALNSAHYSHNAAIKQAYIQRKTAGSLLLLASYMASDINFNDTILSNVFVDSVRHLTTHQASVGIGYGINYTPNQGKVVLHASAAAKMVFYSINQISYTGKQEERGLGIPSYTITPDRPIHFSGSMRAAISWEINRWVHMSVLGKVDNINFRAKTESCKVHLSNWNWQAQFTIGVRFGAGYKNVYKVLPPTPQQEKTPGKNGSLPQWFTDYFFSFRH